MNEQLGTCEACRELHPKVSLCINWNPTIPVEPDPKEMVTVTLTLTREEAEEFRLFLQERKNSREVLKRKLEVKKALMKQKAEIRRKYLEDYLVRIGENL